LGSAWVKALSKHVGNINPRISKILKLLSNSMEKVGICLFMWKENMLSYQNIVHLCDYKLQYILQNAYKKMLKNKVKQSEQVYVRFDV